MVFIVAGPSGVAREQIIYGGTEHGFNGFELRGHGPGEEGYR